MSDKQTIETGTILSVTRRNVDILTDSKTLRCKLPAKIPDLTIGDSVVMENNEIVSCQPRNNFLSRSYRKKTRKIAANLDLLAIVAAVNPLFNAVFIDRVLTAASLQKIPCLMILNKTDLGTENTLEEIQIYEKLGIPVCYTTVVTDDGLDSFMQEISNPDYHTVALAGVSGVGKSSILNNLVPEASRRTGEVSRKTGLGKQTTSLSKGYSLEREGAGPLLMIDLPGIQNFGISNLSPEEIIASFPEFAERRHLCEYLDCKHLEEPDCAVKKALEAGEVSLSRYNSYINMLEEIEACREY